MVYILTPKTALTMINNLQRRDAPRFTSFYSADLAYPDHYLTIFAYPSSVNDDSTDPDFIVAYSPVSPVYTGILYESIQFFSVYINPYTTQILVSPIMNNVLVAYSITKSLVYYYFNETRFPLQFTSPYVNDINGMKRAILNLFGFPTVIFLIDNKFFVQFNYIEEFFEMTINGIFTNGRFILSNFFDFNKTLIISDQGKGVAYWNSSSFQIANNIQQLTYKKSTGSEINMVIGFQSNYMIRRNNGLNTDDISTVNNLSSNTNELKGRGLDYISLAKIIPLHVSSDDEDNNTFFLNGLSGSNYKGNDEYTWAVVQVLNAFNIDNSYVTISMKVVYIPTTPSGTPPDDYDNYDELFYYKIEYDGATDTYFFNVWDDGSFQEFMFRNEGTIMTSDLKLMTKEQLTEIIMSKKGNQKMGNRDWSAERKKIMRYTTYLIRYNDIATSIASNTAKYKNWTDFSNAAEKHYNKFGKKEGRNNDSGLTDQEAQQYLDNNKDLNDAFGNSPDKLDHAKNHWKNHGWYESTLPNATRKNFLPPGSATLPIYMQRDILSQTF